MRAKLSGSLVYGMLPAGAEGTAQQGKTTSKGRPKDCSHSVSQRFGCLPPGFVDVYPDATAGPTSFTSCASAAL